LFSFRFYGYETTHNADIPSSFTSIHTAIMQRPRHLIENFFAKLKQYRAMPTAGYAYATRYDKRAANFLGAIYLAASVIWLN
ncbi:MAG: hypothetical protein V7K92_13135, partial [Nostoc sp.]